MNEKLLSQYIRDGVVNYGVKVGERPEDYKAGANSPIEYEVRNPDGDWEPWLPTEERQTFSIETQACVSYSLNNSIETQIKFLLGKEINLSDRFLAKMSNTQPDGNWLYIVADSARKDGLVLEEEWSVPDGQFSWDKYYEEIPQSLKNKAKTFLEDWDLKYEWVPSDRESLMHHLKHAPLQCVIPGHAILTFKSTKDVATYFDTYAPFKKDYTNYFQGSALKMVVTPKQKMITEKNIDKFYQAIFKRDADEGGRAHWIGKSIDVFLDGVLASPEHAHYKKLFEAGKQIEYFGMSQQ